MAVTRPTQRPWRRAAKTPQRDRNAARKSLQPRRDAKRCEEGGRLAPTDMGESLSRMPLGACSRLAPGAWRLAAAEGRRKAQPFPLDARESENCCCHLDFRRRTSYEACKETRNLCHKVSLFKDLTLRFP